MSMIKNASDEVLIEYFLSATESLNVFVTKEYKRNGTNWSYEIRVDNALGGELVVHEDSGHISFCCYKCIDFNELSQYYTVLKALKWVEENYPQKRAIVYTNSEAFVRSAANSFDFSGEDFGYDCLLNLFSELSRLAHFLSVQVIPRAELEGHSY